MSGITVPFIDLRRAYEALAPDLDDLIVAVARSGHYVLGDQVAELERAAARYLGVKHAITVGSGTDALHLALCAAGIGAGDEVITTPFTFAATLEVIEYVGARAVLVDIDGGSFNIDPERVEEALTPRTRAIVPVHLFGLPADMEAIMEIAARRELAVIEDCAQSLGAEANGRLAGTIGTAGAFSFYPTKTLGCFGDGGMIASNDPGIYEALRELRNHGIDRGGDYARLGYNSRLDELQAAVLNVKLPRLDAANARRRQIAAVYDAALSDTEATLQRLTEDTRHVYGYYTLCVPDRQRVRKRLGRDGVATAIYYPKPLHQYPCYADRCEFGSLPNAERIAARCLSLPIFPEMTDEEVAHVASAAANAVR